MCGLGGMYMGYIGCIGILGCVGVVRLVYACAMFGECVISVECLCGIMMYVVYVWCVCVHCMY